jgi:hypothetical protein
MADVDLIFVQNSGSGFLLFLVREWVWCFATTSEIVTKTSIFGVLSLRRQRR